MEPPPGFELRAVAIEAGAERSYDEAEWRDALVVLTRGTLELISSAGVRSSFERGAVLCLVGLPLRALRNCGSERVVLVAVARRRNVSA